MRSHEGWAAHMRTTLCSSLNTLLLLSCSSSASKSGSPLSRALAAAWLKWLTARSSPLEADPPPGEVLREGGLDALRPYAGPPADAAPSPPAEPGRPPMTPMLEGMGDMPLLNLLFSDKLCSSSDGSADAGDRGEKDGEDATDLPLPLPPPPMALLSPSARRGRVLPDLFVGLLTEMPLPLVPLPLPPVALLIAARVPLCLRDDADPLVGLVSALAEGEGGSAVLRLLLAPPPPLNRPLAALVTTAGAWPRPTDDIAEREEGEGRKTTRGRKTPKRAGRALRWAGLGLRRSLGVSLLLLPESVLHPNTTKQHIQSHASMSRALAASSNLDGSRH